jgi:tripartite-type tricarboxylate transporter receptor subunit TctC
VHSRRAILIAVTGLGLCAASPAASQPYPSHPITIVVPFGPDGATDVLPRMLGERLREALGQFVFARAIGIGNMP